MVIANVKGLSHTIVIIFLVVLEKRTPPLFFLKMNYSYNK